MNTLAFADTTEAETSNASSIASTTQQMSISFGVAIAGLTTAFFLPGTTHTNPLAAIRGLHKAFLLLGALTILSTFVFPQPAEGRWRRRRPSQSYSLRRVTNLDA
jgi:hypothetical protein